MANKYVFNFDEINKVQVITTSGDYTTIYSRKFDDNGNPSTYFVQTYYAPVDESEPGVVKVMCPRCEGWNTFKTEYYNSDDFEYDCKHCEDDYEDYIEENEMVESIMSLLDPETFNDIELFINDIAIV